MSTLREQYERETGRKPADGCLLYLQDYVAWLERRAACAEQLAAACKMCVVFLAQADVPGATSMKLHIKAALAAHEAACKAADKCPECGAQELAAARRGGERLDGHQASGKCEQGEWPNEEILSLRAEVELWKRRANEVLEAGQVLSEGINTADDAIAALRRFHAEAVEAAVRETTAILSGNVSEQILRWTIEIIRKHLGPAAAGEAALRGVK